MLVLGHRGAIVETLSQNSLKAFEEAVACGDGFETDAVLSKDGEIFLIHEAKYVHAEIGVEYCMGEYLDTPSATRLGQRRVDQLSAEEVRELRLKDGQPIPTLRQALEVAGRAGKTVDIELKAFDVVGPVIALLNECIGQKIIAPELVVLSSFNHPALQIARREALQFKVGAIFVGPDQPPMPLFPWRPESTAAYMPLTQQTLMDPVLRDIRPDYIVMPQELLTEDTAAMIADIYPDAKLIAWVFTERANLDLPDLLARLDRLRPSGKVAAMIVDNPKSFRPQLSNSR